MIRKDNEFEGEITELDVARENARLDDSRLENVSGGVTLTGGESMDDPETRLNVKYSVLENRLNNRYSVVDRRLNNRYSVVERG